MEAAYGDGTENLQDIARKFKLWLQDLMSFGENEYKTFLDKIKDADPSEESNINRCREKCEQLSSFLLLSSTNTRKIDHGNVLSQRGGVSQYNREAYVH